MKRIFEFQDDFLPEPKRQKVECDTLSFNVFDENLRLEDYINIVDDRDIGIKNEYPYDKEEFNMDSVFDILQQIMPPNLEGSFTSLNLLDSFVTLDTNSEQSHSSDEDDNNKKLDSLLSEMLSPEWKTYQDECKIESLRSNAKLKIHDKDSVLIWRAKKVIRLLVKKQSEFISLKAGLFYRKPKSQDWTFSNHTEQFCGNRNIQIRSDTKIADQEYLEIKHMGRFVPKDMASLRANNIFYKLALYIQFENELPLVVNLIFKIDNNKTYQNGTTRIRGLVLDNKGLCSPQGKLGSEFVYDSFKHPNLQRVKEYMTDNLVDVTL